MFKKIYKAIKKYDTIVISRHIGVDPDAMASQIALRDAISLTFPSKKVYAVGNGSAKFRYMGKLDKVEEDLSDALLIVLDTPDKKRVDSVHFDMFDYSIKIDHHPYVETFCDLEYIDDTSGSVCQIIMELFLNTKFKLNEEIVRNLYMGMVSDTNRFLFGTTNKTFEILSKMLSIYPISLPSAYQNLYMRPFSEVRLQGYIGENMILTENGVAYIKITNDIINQFQVDSASPGNMINHFNYIEEVLVWVTITEDVKNNIIRLAIRSRGPEINFIAEKYSGGGHKFASGARVSTFEEAMLLIDDLDEVCKKYIKNNL